MKKMKFGVIGKVRMKKKICSVQEIKILLILTGAVLMALIPDNSYSRQDNNNINKIVEQAAVKLANYPQLLNWRVSVLSTAFRMDKDWKPQKETVVRKTVTFRDTERTEEIISAVEIEKNKTKDVTDQFRKDALKEKRKREERRSEGKPEEDGGRRELTMDDMFPFGMAARENYEFILLDDSELESLPVFVLETKAKIRSDKYYEGKYYIAKEDYRILKVELRPAKNPSVLKLFEMEAHFQVIPGGYFVIKETRVRIHVGLVIKNVRLDAVEKYSDYVVLDEL